MFSQIIHADTFSATGGLSLGRNSGLNDIKNPAPLLGADYAFDLGSHFGIGGFYDQNFANFNDGVGGTLRFMGGLLRYRFSRVKDKGIFVDVKLGLSQVSQSNTTYSQIGLRFRSGVPNSLQRSLQYESASEHTHDQRFR